MLGPLDLTSTVPPGCLCGRECWDRFLAEMKDAVAEYGPVILTVRCGTHRALHTLGVTPEGYSLCEHPDCPLEMIV